ncbi:MAG TPA: DUF2225 domain-containing protein [candidate division Zixibacteria bacterium]|nr:DUF2225 domain-containing protein [candidate division Zixibacteria bacterium]
MSLIYEELFTCPNCEVIFQTKVLGSYNTFGECYSDLYVGCNTDPQPILHLINICPKCGFAAFTIDYKTFDIDLSLVKKAINHVEKFTGKKAANFNVGDGFLEIAEYLQNASLEQKSFTLMQASYAYRFLKDSNLDKTRKLILEIIELILQEKKFQNNPEEVYLYLAGELNRLIDNQRKALAYYKEALEKAEKNSFIERITIHQLSNPKNIIPKEIFNKQSRK